MDIDIEFFKKNPDRRTHIRPPAKQPYRDQQRAVRYLDEAELQFRSLGAHDPKQRRMVIYRMPAEHPTHPNHLLKIPVIDYFFDTLRDTDEALMPYVHSLMKEATSR